MISEFTRTICRQLCVERAIQSEAERLERKAAILRSGRPLTKEEIASDEERRR